jgi:hypothetical protein
VRIHSEGGLLLATIAREQSRLEDDLLLAIDHMQAWWCFLLDIFAHLNRVVVLGLFAMPARCSTARQKCS